jgi:hypothetical protein
MEPIPSGPCLPTSFCALAQALYLVLCPTHPASQRRCQNGEEGPDPTGCWVVEYHALFLGRSILYYPLMQSISYWILLYTD